MILLDTNVFYYISKIEPNNEIDVEKLIKYVSNNKCICSMYSLFEILNSHFSFDEKIAVIKYIHSNKIQIESTPEIANKIITNLSAKPKDENYYIELKNIYGEYIVNEISKNIHFFIIAYAYTSATIFLDNYEQGLSKEKKYHRKHFEMIQKEIDKYLAKIVHNKLKNLLYNNSFTAENIQKMLLLLIANIMTYYYELLKYAKILFENKDKNAYYKVIRKFNTLKSRLLKDKLEDNIDFDYKYLSVCKVFIEGFNKTNDENLKTSQVKDILINKIISSVYFVDENMRNDFEEMWLKRNLASLFVESSKIKPNDFIDYEILRKLYYFNDIDLIITFDKKMKRIMNDVKSNKKFVNSINLINSFLIV